MQPISFLHSYGFELELREIQPTDRMHLERGMELLSAESIYFRFNSYLSSLTKQQLDYLTTVDQYNHVAIGAMLRDDTQSMGVGIGRFIRHHNNPALAELALTVIDPFQGMGIGSLLLAGLSQLARHNGINEFTLQIHTDRTHLMQRLRDLGAYFISQNGGVAQLQLPVQSMFKAVIDYAPDNRCAYRVLKQEWN